MRRYLLVAPLIVVLHPYAAQKDVVTILNSMITQSIEEAKPSWGATDWVMQDDKQLVQALKKAKAGTR